MTNLQRLIRSRNCLPCASTWVHPQFLVGSMLLIFLVFCFVLLCMFTFLIPCDDVCYTSGRKMVLGSSLPLVVCSIYRRTHVLFTLFVFVCVYSDVQHILCCVFVLLVCVLCILCCQFLWIVQFLLPLRYYLTRYRHGYLSPSVISPV